MNTNPPPDSQIYQPIDCDLYDELVLLVMQRRDCQIHYRDQQNQVIQVIGVIVDVFSREGREFLMLSQGLEISLDALLRVNGLNF